MSEKKKYQPREVVFANSDTKLSYEIAAGVKRELAKLQQQGVTDWEEGNSYFLTPIRFTPEHDEKGTTALFFIGDFLDTDEDEESVLPDGDKNPITYYVRPTTIRVLQALQIPYQNLAESSQE